MAGPVIDVRATGTGNEVWEPWMGRCVPLDIADMDRLTVVAAHPDDEVLGAGGLIAAARAAGIAVTLVTLTDGGGSHPDSPTCSPRRLAEIRSRESRRAAAVLGADPPIRLGVPDGGVAAAEAAVTEALTELLAANDSPAHRCAVTWRHDGHPDHEAAGRAAAEACASTTVRLLEYPIWMWHWATPAHPALTGVDAAVYRLGPSAHAAKLRAIAEFPSQTRPLSDAPEDAPVLPEHVLRRFTGALEIYFS